jgi:hypothetical protein
MAQDPSATGQHLGSPEGPRILGSSTAGDRPRILQPIEPDLDKESAVNASTPTTSPSLSHPLKPDTTNEVETNVQRDVQSDALIEALRVSRSAMEGLLSKTHDIHEETWRSIQSLFENLHLRLCQECEARVATFEKEIHERGRYQTATLLEIADVEVASRLAAHVDQALEKEREAEQRSTQRLNDSVEVCRTSMAEITNTAMVELQRQKLACLQDLHGEAKKQLHELKLEHLSDFENASQKSADASIDRFTNWANDAIRSYEERLQRLAEEMTQQQEKRLSMLTEAAISQVSNEARAIITRETSTYLIEALRMRLDKLTTSLKD